MATITLTAKGYRETNLEGLVVCELAKHTWKADGQGLLDYEVPSSGCQKYTICTIEYVNNTTQETAGAHV